MVKIIKQQLYLKKPANLDSRFLFLFNFSIKLQTWLDKIIKL